MHVALDRAMSTLPADLFTGRCLLLRFHERQQVSDRFLHHARRFYHLWQKHFPEPKQITDNVHAGHERTLDDRKRLVVISAEPLRHPGQ